MGLKSNDECVVNVSIIGIIEVGNRRVKNVSQHHNNKLKLIERIQSEG